MVIAVLADWLGSSEVTIQTNIFFYNVSVMLYTTTSSWVTSNSNAERLKRVSLKISVVPKMPRPIPNEYTVAWAACRHFCFGRWNKITSLKQCLLLAVEKQKENTEWKKLSQVQNDFLFHFSHYVVRYVPVFVCVFLAIRATVML